MPSLELLKLTEYKLMQIQLVLTKNHFGYRAIRPEQWEQLELAALHIARAKGYDVDAYLEEVKK